MLCLIVTKRRQSCRIKTRGKVSALFIWMQFDLPSFQLENQKKGVAMFHKNTPLKRPKITLGVFQLVERDDASSYFQPPIKKFYARFFALNKWRGKASNVLNINPWRILKCNSMHYIWKLLKMSHLHFSSIFVFLKVTSLVTLFDHKVQVFKNSSNWPFLAFLKNFYPLKM